MTIATTKSASPRPTDMTREEAEVVTKQIKENFDSLGNMLLAAREQKAYKVLGYRTFESYCQSEFGKSSSTAYQAIEDAKVRSQLEARISENYGEDVTLKFPSSHLKPLKVVEGIDDKLKAITYAQKLAESENKKPTKKHLELAVFEITGHRSEDFRKAINELGFTPGTSVETQKPLKTERGVVKRVDKSGKIYVELYYGSNQAIDFDATQLRILKEGEKPASPLEGSVASKGDRVLIYAEGLQGKQGTIYTWKEGKTTLVIVDGETTPTIVAYAEMELLKKVGSKNADWESELVWESGKNTYHYSPQQNTIYSDKWPYDLSIQPDYREKGPIEFIKNWEDKFATKLLESLTTPARLKTLVLAQASELPEAEGKEFVADLITSLNQLFPQASEPPKALGISFSRTIDELISGKKTQTRRAWQDDYAKNFIRYFDKKIAIPALDKSRHRGGQERGFIKLTKRPYQQYLSQMSATDLQEEGGMVATPQEFIDTFFEGEDKLVWVLHFEFLASPLNGYTSELTTENQQLRAQLAEAEATIQTIVNTFSAPSRLASTENTEFLLENTPEIPTPGEAAPGSDFLLESTPGNPAPGEAAPGTDFLLENTAETSTPGDTAAHTDFLLENTPENPAPGESAPGTDFLLENTPEISTPGDTAAHTDFLLENTPENPSPGDTASSPQREEYFPVEMAAQILKFKEKFETEISKIEHQLKTDIPAKETEKNLLSKINRLKNSLKKLEDVQKLRTRQLVRHKKHPEDTGRISWFTLSQGGMPEVIVQWTSETGEKSYIPEKIEMLSVVVD